ncbi:0846a13a-5607-493b-a637-d7d9e5c5a8da [Thermothielavioides terrestris]|uniref:0846a13a-5607-493b-a637-d7d9e5c5a8da n=1 Tax=Thermothielavioides terrestris TaxID=2587410 RepID=A0A3S4AR02_9PEZI|nr:0846a13a-5607-493b-a637-d7d9e5c5a8da [Thermothielavioides terrestris]
MAMDMLRRFLPRDDMLRRLLPRDDDPTTELLKLLADPFSSQLQQSSFFAALGSSLGITAAIAIAFSFLRPYNSVVYAPKLKHADEKHAPPPLGKGVFAWIFPLWTTNEQDMVNLVGLDAALFMRFTRMCRNIFIVLTVLGCSILIPINYINFSPPDDTWLARITPRNVWGAPLWATVVFAWLLTIIVCGFLWWNYRKVLQLRRQYMESEEYQHGLHARTLMLYDIPKNLRTDEGIARIIDHVAPNSSFSRTAVARDVKILPDLINQHDKTVRKLEKVLAIYLKDPHNLPAERPKCSPSKKDPSYGTYPRGHKVDAIEYLTQRIKVLELEIKDFRQRVDKRGSMPYGFASFADIAEAHSIAYACRKKKPYGATVKLAPRPNDIIWENMPLSPSTRSTRRLWNNLWTAVLTLLWIAPNAMIAIFLVNLTNLGHVWHAFQVSLTAHYTIWSIIQGIASPALMSLVYLVLPIIFRRMSIRAGDQTKTGRERHVVAKLYAFFVVNNLIVVSVFGAIWSFTANVVQQTEGGTDAWKAILDANFGLTVFLSLCSFSPFWVAWLLQRQLGAAVDLAQLWTLLYSFIMRKFFSPTPRELIELTAPPPFDYASYYNYFLFYSTVALCYAAIQPLVLPAAALYFCIDVALKKYLLLYIFVTKNESGGMFWRILFNRILFGSILSHLIVFLVVWVRGDASHVQAYAVAPLPFLMIAFKFYCTRAFDNKLHYYATRYDNRYQSEAGLDVKEQSMRNDRLAARFGHPALYKALITPMVHAKAQNMLASVYQGRLSDGRDAGLDDSLTVSGYSDTYVLDTMSSGKAGKTSSSMPGFEVVPESRLDFEFYKNRDEFAEDHGGGEIFGRPSDLVRPGTPGTIGSGAGSDHGSRPGTPLGGMGFGAGRRAYPGQPAYSTSTFDMPSRSRSPLYSHANESGTNLVAHAAGMPVSPAGFAPTSSPYGRDASFDIPTASASVRGYGGIPSGGGSTRAPGMLGGGPHGYGGLPQTDDSDGIHSPPLGSAAPSAAAQDPAQYDYFRGSSRRREVAGPPGMATRGGGGAGGGGGGGRAGMRGGN